MILKGSFREVQRGTEQYALHMDAQQGKKQWARYYRKYAIQVKLKKKKITMRTNAH